MKLFILFAAAIVLLAAFLIPAILKKTNLLSGRLALSVRVLGCLLAVVLAGVSCLSTVPAGHTGVVTTFGRVEDYTLDSGIHMTLPWQNVVNMDNRVQKRTVELPCFSSDIQEVNMAYTVNYQISKADAMTLYRTVGTSYYDTVIAPNVAEAVKVCTARYTAEDLVGMRDELAVAIEKMLGQKLVQYHIEVTSTSIENMDFTDVFTAAVEAKQVAQQDKLRAQTEAEQKIIEANAAADVRKVNADAEAYEVLRKAEAEAEANQKIADSLTPDLIDYLYAQEWDGQLPSIVSGAGSGSSLIVNAQELLRPESSGAASAQTPAPQSEAAE